jgi:hypothetical protein
MVHKVHGVMGVLGEVGGFTAALLVLGAVGQVLGQGCGRAQAAEAAPGTSAAAAGNVRAGRGHEHHAEADKRAPLPLPAPMAAHQKQNMREHLEAVQQIAAALASGDFAGVEKAGARIGFSEQMGAMCTHLGAAAPGFTEQALAFHRKADEIGAAARTHDAGKVLTALAGTLETCTGCHAVWRQEVVSEAEWKRLAAGARRE